MVPCLDKGAWRWIGAAFAAAAIAVIVAAPLCPALHDHLSNGRHSKSCPACLLVGAVACVAVSVLTVRWVAKPVCSGSLRVDGTILPYQHFSAIGFSVRAPPILST